MYLTGKASEAEAAAKVGDSKTLYRIGKDLSGYERKLGMPIKDDNEKTLSTHEEQFQKIGAIMILTESMHMLGIMKVN